jgi:hypothetical protein
VGTYNLLMKVSLSIDDETLYEVRRRAEALGTSANQLIREYLEQFAGRNNRAEAAEEFMRLSRLSHGDFQGWKFSRDELHER